MNATALRTVVSLLFIAGLAGAATLPDETCTSTGASSRTCSLIASVNSISLPTGATVPVWTYALADGGVPSLPGPTLIVRQGETVTVRLENQLAEPTALFFHGQEVPPDLVGAAAHGGVSTMSFVASRPGTFLYEAGLLPNAAHQVAMGLFGVLIVRPSTLTQAYSTASSTFDDEALVVLSELDPALNQLADPSTFDLRDFSPKYFLINGKAFPQTDAIATDSGRRVLLRYVNAGLQNHSMALLGLEQRVLALDGHEKRFEGRVVAESIGTGQTLDTIATVAAGVPVGSRFALYDASFTLHNDGAPGLGGMLTFLSTGPVVASPTGPVASGVLASPNPTNGVAPVTLTALVSSPGGAVVAAEYSIDRGALSPMTASDGAFGDPTEAVRATISVTGLTAGIHIVSVRGQDANGKWSPFNFTALRLDTAGPATSAVMAMPSPTNGTVDVMLSATGDDSASGGSNVSEGEYFLDAVGSTGTGAPMMSNVSASQVSLTAMLPAATVLGLSEGVHTVSVRSQDGLGNWGALATTSLTVDRTGPALLAFLATPNPNNGTSPLNQGTPVVRLTATLDDTATGGAVIVGAEAFIDTVGVTGTGAVFLPRDGQWNSASELAFSDLPLSTIKLLSVGAHTLYAHARDQAGNWGPLQSLLFIIDQTAPTASGLSLLPNPTNAAASENSAFVASFTATDVGLGNSAIARGEWFEGVDPGVGLGVPMAAADGAFDSPTEQVAASIDFVALGWAVGNHAITVRARDAAGNWSAPLTGLINVVLPNTVFADGFESKSFAAWNGGVTGAAGLSVTGPAALQGAWGMQATLRGNAPRYVTDLRPVNEPSYHARFRFSPNGVNSFGGSQTIFSGLDAAALELFRLEFRRLGPLYQVRGWVRTTTGSAVTPFVNLTNAPHSLEVGWNANAPAVFDVYVDGVRQRLTGLNTAPFRLESARLGPSAGLSFFSSGSEYFDAFVSTRRTVIGP